MFLFVQADGVLRLTYIYVMASIFELSEIFKPCFTTEFAPIKTFFPIIELPPITTPGFNVENSSIWTSCPTVTPKLITQLSEIHA